MSEEVKLVSENIAYSGSELHNDLDGRYYSGAHTIDAIDDLRVTLDELQALKNIESKNRGIAQYYEWADGNIGNEDRIGLFVTLVDGTDTIRICKNKEEDVFGVIVSANDMGMVSGAFDASINEKIEAGSTKYGLVCHTGKVKVCRESNVQIGDCVIPDALGKAKKSVVKNPIIKAYYDIIEIENGLQVYSLSYEPITSEIEADNLRVYIITDDNTIGNEVVVGTEASGKVIAVNKMQITVHIGEYGYANGDKFCALYKYESNGDVGYKVTSISKESGEDYAYIDLSSSNSALVRLQDRFNDINKVMSAMEQNVVTAINLANFAYDKVDDGFDDDDDSGSSGINKDTLNIVVDAQLTANNAVKLANQIEDDLAELNDIHSETREQVDNATSEIADIWAGISSTSEYPQSLIGRVAQYSVGEVSQAKGLTLAQAQKIVPHGSVYVPIKDCVEIYGEEIQAFTRGHSYMWDADKTKWTIWDENIQNVVFSSLFVEGASGRYWYTESDDNVDDNGMTYPKETLYRWDDGAWEAVATLGDNGLGRTVSLVQQNENEFKSEIASVNGQYAGLVARVESDEVAIGEIARISNANTESLALTNERVTATEASITQLTEFATNVTMSEMIYGEPPSGEYYAIEPKWVAKSDENKEYEWSFGDSGSSQPNAGVLDDGVNYCYATNPNDSRTYYKYECYHENQWARTTISMSTSMAGVIQKADATGASVLQIVEAVGSDGVVNAASIALAINDSGSMATINADRIDFEANDFKLNANYIDFDAEDFVLDAKNIDMTSADFTLNADQINFTAGSFGSRNLLLATKDVEEELPIVYRLSKLPEDGVTYTLTLESNITEGKHINVLLSNINDGVGTDNSILLGTLAQENENIYSTKFTWTYSDDTKTIESDIGNLFVVITVDTQEIEEKTKVRSVKLEQGNSISSDWTPAPEDQVSAEQTGTTMSWKMLPDKCVWWNNVEGTNAEESPLMKLDKDGLYVKGEVDATKGTLGGNTIDENGLHINNGDITLGSTFSVTSNGLLNATGANISGTFTATSGTIGGFTIDSDNNINCGISMTGNNINGELKTGNMLLSSKGRVYSGSISGSEKNQWWRFIIGPNFGVNASGTLYASGANIEGKITATTGEISGFTLSGSELYRLADADGNYGICLRSKSDDEKQDPLFAVGMKTTDGHWADSPFCVFYDGHIKATSGTISGFTFNGSELYRSPTDNITNLGICIRSKVDNVSTDPLFAIGKKKDDRWWKDSPFCIFYDGRMKASSGTIGRFGFDNDNGIYLKDDNGNLVFGINNTGTLEFDHGAKLTNLNGKLHIEDCDVRFSGNIYATNDLRGQDYDYYITYMDSSIHLEFQKGLLVKITETKL